MSLDYVLAKVCLLSLFWETLTNGKQALNLFLTVRIKFVYQSAPLVYNAPQFSDSI